MPGDGAIGPFSGGLGYGPADLLASRRYRAGGRPGLGPGRDPGRISRHLRRRRALGYPLGFRLVARVGGCRPGLGGHMVVAPRRVSRPPPQGYRIAQTGCPGWRGGGGAGRHSYLHRLTGCGLVLGDVLRPLRHWRVLRPSVVHAGVRALADLPAHGGLPEGPGRSGRDHRGPRPAAHGRGGHGASDLSGPAGECIPSLSPHAFPALAGHAFDTARYRPGDRPDL